MVLWRKFDQFQEGTDFAVWAMSVARFCALNWRRKQARLPLPRDDEFLIMKRAPSPEELSTMFEAGRP